MKKKIKDLTIGELIDNCKKQENPNCLKCLLKECYMYEECAIFRIDFKDLDKQVGTKKEGF